MPYSPPACTVVNFELTTGYTPPASSAVNFTLGETGIGIDGALAHVTASLTAHNTQAPGNIAVTLPAVTASMTASQSGVAVEATLPHVTASLAATFTPRYQAGWSHYLASPTALSRISGTNNQTYTAPNPASTYSPVLSAIGYRTGKHYAEIEAIYIASTSYVGLRAGLSLRSNPLDDEGIPGSNAFSWCADPFGYLVHNGSSVAGGISYQSATATVILGFAVDSDAGKMWMSVNGTWCGGGDPAAGTSPTFTDTDIIGEILHLEFAWENNSRSAVIREMASQFSYTPPAGFIPWAQDVWEGSDWDNTRKLSLAVDEASSSVIRYDLPVRVTLQENSGTTFYDATYIQDDLYNLTRRFAVYDNNGTLCETTLVEVTPEASVRRNIPANTTAYATASDNPDYAHNAAWAAYQGNPFYKWESTYPPAVVAQVKFNVNLGAAYPINYIRIENYISDNGMEDDCGIHTATFYGTNSATAYANVDYTNLDDLTLLTSVELGELENKDLYFDNSTSFQYFVIRIHDNLGNIYVTGLNHVAFYEHTPAKFEFVTILPEVSATVDEPFFVYWNTAKYEHESNIVVDYNYTPPITAETAVKFPETGDRHLDIVASLPPVTATIEGRNFAPGVAPALISASIHPVTAAITATHLDPPYGRISVSLPKVRATAHATSGNRIKLTLPHMTATGITATSVLYFEELHAGVSGSLKPVEANLYSGAIIRAEAIQANGSMAASTNMKAGIDCSIGKITARMQTGAHINGSSVCPVANMHAVNGCGAGIAATIPRLHGIMAAHEVPVRHGSVSASLPTVRAEISATAEKPTEISAKAPTITCTMAASVAGSASIQAALPRIFGRVRASAGGESFIEAAIPAIVGSRITATTEIAFGALRHRRGESR